MLSPVSIVWLVPKHKALLLEVNKSWPKTSCPIFKLFAAIKIAESNCGSTLSAITNLIWYDM